MIMLFQYAAFADESSDTFAGQVDALTRNDLQFLEIRNLDGKNVTKLTLAEAKEYDRILREHGLRVDSLGSPIGKIKINDDFDAHLELYKHTLELANVFGANKIRLFSFFMPKGEDPAQYETLVLERMAIFANVAKEFGVIPCHENEKGIYGDTADRCLQILQAVPGIKAVFDPANFVQCGQDTLAAWEQLAPYVQYMHIKDALPDGKVVPPGQGVGNVPQLIAKYAAQGGKVLSLEPHLFEFVGLKSLEQEGEESIVGAMSFTTAEEAFDYAVHNLKMIVEGLQ